MTDAETLAAGVSELHLRLAPGGEGRLLDYARLVGRWNRVYNLVSRAERGDFIRRHVLDSLTVIDALSARNNIADVGSGAGLPGIPLAIARPDARFTLVEGREKKAAFLREAQRVLALDNVAVASERVEEWDPPLLFDAVVSRAFAELGQFCRLAGHLLARGGRMYAMKGSYPGDELQGVPAGYRIERVLPLKAPGLAAARHLVVITREI